MPFTMAPPAHASLLTLEPLSQEAFSQFGSVISNPAPHITPNATLSQLPPGAVPANQGSAHKYPDITSLVNLYISAPSGAASWAAMSMFVCAPRVLQQSSQAQDGSSSRRFPVAILERHPFTSQTFIPLGLSANGPSPTRYLVIVAPSLDRAAGGADAASPEARRVGQNLPDLARMRAFVATGAQGVTYGPGTWHAPMVVVGHDAVSFVVAQYVNGVAEEDCQEVAWDGSAADALIRVAVPDVGA